MIIQHVEPTFPDIETKMFRLGMPHMSATGVQPSWLLREACHMHWAAIAQIMGVHPSQFRDKSGARVLASVVACTINGNAEAFREDDACQLSICERPSAENGWRSKIELRSDAKSLTAEIVTSFARRNGHKNAEIEPAELEPAFEPDLFGDEARRASFLLAAGMSDRARAEPDRNAPHMSFQIEKDSHLNGVGMVYFSQIHDMVARTEQNSVPELTGVFPLRNRRVHFFANLDAGDRLEVTARASAQAFTPAPSVVVHSHCRRASDGEIIACAESIYGFA